MKYTLLLSLVLASCGGGTDNTSVTTGCVSTIVSELSQMTTPSFVGLGTPDSTTYYPAMNGLHKIEYVFNSAHKKLIFTWTDQGMCTEIAETF
jgi:hypothetical protein